MKIMRNLLILILSLVLVFSLFACDDEKCTEHIDKNKDLKCDVCGEAVEQSPPSGGGGDEGEAMTLIENGKAKFQIVCAGIKTSDIVLTIQEFIDKMAQLGVEIELVDDSGKNKQDIEILVGDITSRGDKYDYDEHNLGKKGYIVTRIDNKILINAGSSDTLIKQFKKFVEDVIGLNELSTEESVKNVSYSENNELLYVQDDYRIPSITVNGVDIRDYTIATDVDFAIYNNAALSLQDALYTRVGYWLEIVPLDEATNKSIIIKEVEKTDGKGNAGLAEKEGFVVKANKDGQLNIYCAYNNALANAMSSFIANLSIKTEAIDFSSSKAYFKKEVSIVRYEDYEALTDDDKTNDFEALIEVHAYANEGGQPVYAESGAKYYIYETKGRSIIIQTDCSFGNARFYIDDTFITDDSSTKTERNQHIFSIKGEASFTIKKGTASGAAVDAINARGGIKTTDTELILNLGYDAIVVPYNNSRIMYNRGGENGNASGGHVQHEAIFVRADNSIDPNTRPLFDFDNVDYLVVYRADCPTITLSGGYFETIATRADMKQSYVNRGIAITRSNTIIDGMTHYVDNQPLGSPAGRDESGQAIYNDGGPNYNGWLVFSGCHNVTVQNTKLCGRTHYRQGSYDIGGGNASNLKFINCTQYNMYTDEKKELCYDQTGQYWGIMGTSYLKNIQYYDSVLSRLDAHAGVFNITISGCKIRTVSVVGGGLALIENSTIYSNSVVSLRSDYGSTWRGEIRVINTQLRTGGGNVSIVSGIVHDADYGYNTVLPDLYIENVTHDRGADYAGFYLFTLSCDQKIINNGAQINLYTPGNVAIIKQPEGYRFKAISPYVREYGNNFTYVLEVRYEEYIPQKDDE